MESIFENTTTLTRQNLTELARTTAPKWSWLTGLIPALLAVLAAVWGLVKNGIGLGPGLLLLAAAAPWRRRACGCGGRLAESPKDLRKRPGPGTAGGGRRQTRRDRPW